MHSVNQFAVIPGAAQADTPYSRRQSLLSKSLSFFGVDATYACAIAIVRRVIELEVARLA